MTKILATLLIPFVLFGFDISFDKKFEKQIVPDKLKTNITVTAVKISESEITPELNSFNEFISKSNNVEKRAGEFSVRPKYKYNKGQSTLIGYTGTLTYTIFSDNQKDMNNFIKSLLNLKNDKDISVSLSGLSWIVSKSKRSILVDDLRLESIMWAKDYATKISKDINSNCKVKNITISSGNYNPVYRNSRADVMMLSSTKHESNIPVPQANKNIVSIKPNYVLECK